jgi:hypothetical protein
MTWFYYLYLLMDCSWIINCLFFLTGGNTFQFPTFLWLTTWHVMYCICLEAVAGYSQKFILSNPTYSQLFDLEASVIPLNNIRNVENSLLIDQQMKSMFFTLLCLSSMYYRFPSIWCIRLINFKLYCLMGEVMSNS